MSSSWHHSCVYYQTSFPCVSASPAWRYLCLHPGCRPIYLGTHGDWKDMRAHTGFIIQLEEGIHIKMPECVHHFYTWIGQLKDWYVQSCRSQPPLFPTPLVTPAMMLTACSLTGGGVSIGVHGSLSGKEGGKPPLPTVASRDLGGHPC